MKATDFIDFVQKYAEKVLTVTNVEVYALADTIEDIGPETAGKWIITGYCADGAAFTNALSAWGADMYHECGHDHDCCGCSSYRVHLVSMRNEKFVISFNHYKNY